MTRRISKGDIRDIRSHPDWGKRRKPPPQPGEFRMYPHPHWDEDGFGPNYRTQTEDDIDLNDPEVQSIAEHLINWPEEPETPPKKKSFSPFPFAIWPNTKPRNY